MSEFFNLIIVLYLSLSAQTDKNNNQNDTFKADSIIKEERRISTGDMISDQVGPIDFVVLRYSTEEWVSQRAVELPVMNYHIRAGRRYLAVIDLEKLVGGKSRSNRFYEKDGLIMIGFQKPIYELSIYPRVRGKMEMKFESELAGFHHRMLISYIYELERSGIENKFKSSVYFDGLYFIVKMPFGAK